MNGQPGYQNRDLYSRDPESPSQDRDPLAASGSVRYGAGEDNRIVFVFLGRFSYIAPPTGGVTFALLTVTPTITRGLITEIGIGSPQFDFFGTQEYFFAVNGSAPYNQQYQLVGGPGPVGSFLAFTPVGTLQRPYKTRIPVKSNDQLQMVVPPQNTPQGSTVVYNVFIRVGGELYR